MTLAGRFSPGERLIDSRLGLIKRAVRQPRKPGIPRSVVTFGVEVSSTDRYASWRADRYAYGAALDDDDRALRAAVGEAVERYCGNVVPLDLSRDSFARLRAAGRAAVDPLDLSLYSERQYRQPGFPFVPMTRELEIAWAPARDLVTGVEVLAPASLVYLNFDRATQALEPPTNLLIYAGIAAGESPEQAQRRAVEEALERDAVTIWWLSGAPATGIDVSDEPCLQSVLADPDADGLTFSFLQIPSSFSVPVIGVFAEDPARSLVAFGSACRATPEAAAAKALTEAIQLLDLGMELLDPGSPHWRGIELGMLDAHPYRPYRADRAYRKEFRDDYRDMHDLTAHVQFYLDPRVQGPPLDRLRKPAGSVRLDRLPTLREERARDLYLARLTAKGLRALSVDLTTADVAAAGLAVARVVTPGLYSNAPAAFPFLGGHRLYEEPVANGWMAGPITEGDLVLHPLPYG